ncbi:phage tail assembly chaperone [Brevundimonas sp. Root1279]|uniref:phage tail assembly chaperone n=1 Tax=Brevundimonas sp. Root1279 TaxID=1736443 RepID=UPI003FA42870
MAEGLAQDLITYAGAVQGEIEPLPPFPEALAHVWACFGRLAGTRQPAQVVAPITYVEIEAFDAGTFSGLTAWEKALIRRIDDRVRAVSLGLVDPNPQPQGGGLTSFLRAKAEASRKRKEKANG